MSDYLDGLGFPNLSPITNSDPQDSEVASNIPAALRQVKAILTTFLNVSFDPATGLIKASGLPAASIADNSVSGSVDNSATANAGKLKQGTVSTKDLRDNAVTIDKLADNAVDTAAIVALAVTAAKIAAATITYDKMAADSIRTAHIKDGEITAAKFAAGAVAAAAIGVNSLSATVLLDNTLTPLKLAGTVTDGQLLVGDSSGAIKAAWKTITGVISIDKNGVTTFGTSSLAIGHVRFREMAATTVAGGASVAAADITGATIVTTGNRGATTGVPWEKSGTFSSDFIVSANGKITCGRTGAYIITISAPAFAVGRHQVSLQRLNAGSTVIEEFVLGSSEVAPATIQSRSMLTCVMSVVIGQILQVKHYFENAVATNGMGYPSSSGAPECYAIMEILVM